MKPLAKSVLIPLGLTTAVSAADAGIHKKILGSGHNTNLLISNDDMLDLFKVIRSLEDSGLLLKGLLKQLKMNLKSNVVSFLVCCLVCWVRVC